VVIFVVSVLNRRKKKKLLLQTKHTTHDCLFKRSALITHRPACMRCMTCTLMPILSLRD